MSAVLLVDDEPFVLKSLARLLCRTCPEWRVIAVGSAKEALEELAKAPYDVVVSDMRMPGMDGAELLACVREKQPLAARIILTGHAERAVMARALAVAHELLEKPCSGKEIVDAIERNMQLATCGTPRGISRHPYPLNR